MPGEGPKAFAAFCIYRDQGPARSLDKAWRAAHPQAGHRRRSKTWAEWSSRWRWLTRAEEFDAHVELEGRKRFAKELQDAKARHARVIQANLQAAMVSTRVVLETLNDATQLAQLVTEARQSPARLKEHLDRSGRHANAVVQLVECERLILGMSTTIVEVEGRRETFGDRISRDPEATALAIMLLDRLAGTGDGTPPADDTPKGRAECRSTLLMRA